MSDFFLKIFNMSISASWIILTVIVLRLLLKKAPKWINVLLWGIVAVRLICPLTFESTMSLIPSAETIPAQPLTSTPQISTGIPAVNSALNPIIQETNISVSQNESVNVLQLVIHILSKVWIVGVALLLTYSIISYLRIKKKIETAILLRDNIYQSETVVSPFVLGTIKPKIYLPFSISERDIESVITHEQAHIKRKDYIWKPLGFLLLTLHWFNPLIWLGYVLLCRDIELACDEKAIKDMNIEQRADYSQALLACSVNRHMIAACPIAFGEVNVKNRIINVLHYKKPTFWIILAAIIASITVAICFLTNPVQKKESVDDNKTTEHNTSADTNSDEVELFWPDFSINEITNYLDSATFDIDGDGIDEQCSLGYGPTSGIYSFTFSAYENGELEYFNIFASLGPQNMHFETNAEGQVILCGTQLIMDAEPYTCYMGISIDDGNIVITSDEQNIAYWGKQGINSPFAPKNN